MGECATRCAPNTAPMNKIIRKVREYHRRGLELSLSLSQSFHGLFLRAAGWSAKSAESPREVLGGHCRQTQQSRLELGLCVSD